MSLAPGARRVVLLVIGLAAGLWSGCGGHGSTGARAGTHQSSGPARVAHAGPGATVIRERAFAQAVNLTRRDLPGFTVSSEQRERETPAQQQLQRQLDVCLGGGAGEPGGGLEAGSGQFRRQAGLVNVTVSSAVSFFGNPVLAEREVTLLRSRHTGDCLTAYLDARYGGRRLGAVVIGHITVRQGTPPAPGTSGGFAWRINAPLRLRGIAVPFYLDMLGFVYRQAEVRLVSSSVIAPFPAAGQESLYRLLLTRATGQHL
jgi:hypothetical protein